MRLGLLLFICQMSICAELLVISTNTHHLGRQEQPEWDVFENRKPSGEKLRLTFRAQPNKSDLTLFIRQDDVKQDWTVALNGLRLGSLFLMEEDLVHMLRVPPNALRPGENILEFTSRSPDDILIHDVRLGAQDFVPLRFEVREGSSLLPCRITVVTSDGALAPLKQAGQSGLAIRPGVIYTGSGIAEVLVPSGQYTIYATRGPEYSLGTKEVFANEENPPVQFQLTRDVNTEGWAAADTHIHTFTFSRHGDATLEERMVTLAGEAVEIPVSTDHNQHASYLPAAQKQQLEKWFSLVPGNEVTTAKGHFNIFPVRPDDTAPNHKIEHWPDLMREIRDTAAPKLIILNHPTDRHSGFVPFASTNLNLITGKNLRGFDFQFDGMEVINSGAMNSDWMAPFRAWFALLNRGLRVVGVGASDSHDVSRFIVGQGRTYVQVDDSPPGATDIAQACENLKTGRAVVSLGLFTQMQVDGSAGPGDTHKPRGKDLIFEVSVASPRWIGKTSVALYANAQKIRESALSPSAVHQRVKWTVPRVKQDVWYVVIATGPGVDEPYWGYARPYQPSTPNWRSVSIGATNPIYVDADRNGQFESPRQIAQRLFARSSAPDKLLKLLADYDWATAAQAAELLQESGTDLTTLETSSAPEHVRRAFSDFSNSLRQ